MEDGSVYGSESSVWSAGFGNRSVSSSFRSGGPGGKFDRRILTEHVKR